MNAVVYEERAAEKKRRAAQRLARHNRRARERQTARAIAAAVRDTARGHKACRCQFAEITTREHLAAMGGGCTMPYFACPRLDAIRRRVGA